MCNMAIETENNILLEQNRETALRNLSGVLNSQEETRLREHQISMVQSFFDFLSSGERAGFIVGAAGSGKSALIGKIAEVLGLKTVILSPSTPILRHNQTEASEFAPTLDLTNYYGREKDLSGLAINTTYQSMVTLLEKVKAGTPVVDRAGNQLHPEELGLVICDEAHAGLGEIRRTIYQNFPNAIFLGVTATPYFGQLEGYKKRGLINGDEPWLGLFTKLIHELSMEEAIERGISPDIDIRLLKTRIKVKSLQADVSGEYNEKELERYFAGEARNALIIGLIAGVENLPDWIRLPDELRVQIEEIHRDIASKKTGVFGVSINNVEQLAHQLRSLNIRAEAVHGQTADVEKSFTDFNTGDTQILLGVDLLRTGVDLPPMEATIHGRPTASGVYLTQEVGRGMRQSPETGKEKLIAVQLVDEVTGGILPLLIPQLFSPDFIVQGSSTGRERSVGSAKAKNRPKITIRGMDIEAIFERARASELIATRFENATLDQMSQFLDELINQVSLEEPELNIYSLLKEAASRLPDKVPMVVGQTVVEGLESDNEETKKTAKRALILVTLRTLLSVVDLFYDPLRQTRQVRDEMVSAALASLETVDPEELKVAYGLKGKIHGIVGGAMTVYLKESADIPTSLSYPARGRSVIKEMQDVGVPYLNPDEKNRLFEEIVEIYGTRGISFERPSLEEYSRVLNTVRYPFWVEEDSVAGELDELEREVEIGILEDLMDDGLRRHLTPREAAVLRMRWGLEEGNEYTHSQVAEQLNITTSRAGQIEDEAIYKLRTSISFMKTFRYELWPDDSVAPQPEEEGEKVEKKEIPPILVALEAFMGLGYAQWYSRKLGMRDIGDIFVGLPDEKEFGKWLLEDKKYFKAGLSEVLKKLEELSLVSLKRYPMNREQGQILNSITDTIFEEWRSLGTLYENVLSYMVGRPLEREFLLQQIGYPSRLSPDAVRRAKETYKGLYEGAYMDIIVRQARQIIFSSVYFETSKLFKKYS